MLKVRLARMPRHVRKPLRVAGVDVLRRR